MITAIQLISKSNKIDLKSNSQMLTSRINNNFQYIGNSSPVDELLSLSMYFILGFGGLIITSLLTSKAISNNPCLAFHSNNTQKF